MNELEITYFGHKNPIALSVKAAHGTLYLTIRQKELERSQIFAHTRSAKHIFSVDMLEPNVVEEEEECQVIVPPFWA